MEDHRELLFIFLLIQRNGLYPYRSSFFKLDRKVGQRCSVHRDNLKFDGAMDQWWSMFRVSVVLDL